MTSIAARKGLVTGLVLLLGSCLAVLDRVAAAPDDPVAAMTNSATNPLAHQEKIKNYLPDMRWPEVEAFLKRSDIVLIPVAAMEQHGPQGPIGTDFINCVSTAQLIAQRADVLVAPVLMVGNSPYHMGFPGTMTLPEELIQEVYFQAAKGFLTQGFKRFIFYNCHGGNAATTPFIVDRINQETGGVAVELGEAISPYREKRRSGPIKAFDEHAGIGETSNTMYLNPGLVDLSVARTAKLTYPPHLQAMVPKVLAGDPTANLVFHAEALKATSTGKNVSTREMSDTGVWSEMNPNAASAAIGKATTESTVTAAVKFIEAWNQLRPSGTK